MKYLEVVNLDKYQHYSGRANVWVKWYVKCLSDYKFEQLTDAERWLFVGVVILAVQEGNNIPFDPLWVRNSVCFVGGKGVSKVRAGLLKMVKLGLLRGKNASTERKIREDKEEKISSVKSKKPFYKVSGEEMRQDARGKWWVIPKNNGTWLDFADKQDKIGYR